MKTNRYYLFAALIVITEIAVVVTGCGPTSETSSPAAKGGSNASSSPVSTSAPGTDPSAPSTKPISILNVSYDPTREFYTEFNAAFAEHWKKTSGQTVEIHQSHAGSGKQARAVIDGLPADVVTLALAYDINAIVRKGKLIHEDWQTRLPQNSAPYTSTIVFLVRKGNPKKIKDWDDLVKGDVSLISPNPKTSGGARWNYLAAWGYVLKRELGDLKKVSDPASASDVEAAQKKALEFVTEIFKRVSVLDSGARGATNTFAQRDIGDVLITWENDAYLALNELGKDKLEIVAPSVSILAEPPVSVVDAVAEKRGTQAVAEAYLKYLYTPEGQKLAAKHYYRPAVEGSVTAEELSKFAKIELFTIQDAFGGWDKAQGEHFNDGGVFDKIYQPGK